MDFNLKWEISLFREEQNDLFDKYNKNERYTSTPIGKQTAERMLLIINELEVYSLELEKQIIKAEDKTRRVRNIIN